MTWIATIKPSSHINKLWRRWHRIGGSLGDNRFILKDGLYVCTQIKDMSILAHHPAIILECFTINPDKIILSSINIPQSDTPVISINKPTKKRRKDHPKAI